MFVLNQISGKEIDASFSNIITETESLIGCNHISAEELESNSLMINILFVSGIFNKNHGLGG